MQGREALFCSLHSALPPHAYQIHQLMWSYGWAGATQSFPCHGKDSWRRVEIVVPPHRRCLGHVASLPTLLLISQASVVEKISACTGLAEDWVA